MSLPNYLAAIKSSGIYRFIWDKSQIATTDAEVLRLLVGYSEKGPFNTLVYVKSVAEFKSIFGDINKKLERRGIFFHRMAIQALAAGPILCLNLKKFDNETVQYTTGDTILTLSATNDLAVTSLYDTKRFWTIDPDILPTKTNSGKYITISAADTDKQSNTIFVRQYKPVGYDVTVAEWYAQQGEELPEWAEGHENARVSDYFAEIYVFRGEFTPELVTNGALSKYFEVAYTYNGNTVTVTDGVYTYEGTSGTVTLTAEQTADVVTTLQLKELGSDAFGNKRDTLEVLSKDASSNFVNAYRGCLLPYFKGITGTYSSLDLVFNRDYAVHKMVMKLDADLLNSDTFDIEQIVAGYSSSAAYPEPIYLKGYTYTTPLPEVTNTAILTWQNTQFSTLTEYDGLLEALTNNKDSQWRYLVDTFATIPSTGMKTEFAYLASLKFNALAILNFPSVEAIKSAESYNKTNGGVDFNKVTTLTSLPSEEDGASWAAFYTPVIFSDGTVKTIVPSAALVSNKFMDKYTTYHPYDVVAGPNRSRFIYSGLVGPDYNYSRSELDLLEPFGVNAVVYVPRQGIYINSNKTAKQNPITTLSAVNVRELCTYIQDEIDKIMNDYHWEMNTPELRDRLKERADSLLENIKANGGVYVYRNVCDDSNNSDEVIDNEMLVLSTEIEPGRGTGKMVQELTLYKKGGLSAIIK